ncbi:hypothetical protein PF010_g26245 [Phytophthora fragariae]|uniref:Uncharacterized protein n=1 Tax=Phytophthora fragariae TaxID=53985 RepID=A0A6A3S8L6_9STRA|nr:hypothetical protein PF003_g18622 [Phytophthora fragariae]KAE8922044.1 hypothetical protein PF009_g27682 [Phytophthora fragariae]KAE9070492.1 hypothetical protein PF010_g26245 [Phytophthora fragariae]KAE9103511.1 hypothetical protein PF006_g22153 [Phytophthora fragariae]KAE9112062.1 hypothetical protein PF007_g11245 [Phytophthora fragariae]
MIDTSDPVSRSATALTLLILLFAFACLKCLSGTWCFQYPRDSPDCRSKVIVASDRWYSSTGRRLATIAVRFLRTSHVLLSRPACNLSAGSLGFFSTNA